jgi:uncharacterized membrane protein
MNPLTEDQIECRVEKMTDRADARFMGGEIDEPEYKAQLKEIDMWASDAYALAAQFKAS